MDLKWIWLARLVTLNMMQGYKRSTLSPYLQFIVLKSTTIFWSHWRFHMLWWSVCCFWLLQLSVLERGASPTHVIRFVLNFMFSESCHFLDKAMPFMFVLMCSTSCLSIYNSPSRQLFSSSVGFLQSKNVCDISNIVLHETRACHKQLLQHDFGVNITKTLVINKHLFSFVWWSKYAPKVMGPLGWSKY